MTIRHPYESYSNCLGQEGVGEAIRVPGPIEENRKITSLAVRPGQGAAPKEKNLIFPAPTV